MNPGDGSNPRIQYLTLFIDGAQKLFFSDASLFFLFCLPSDMQPPASMFPFDIVVNLTEKDPVVLASELNGVSPQVCAMIEAMIKGVNEKLVTVSPDALPANLPLQNEKSRLFLLVNNIDFFDHVITSVLLGMDSAMVEGECVVSLQIANDTLQISNTTEAIKEDQSTSIFIFKIQAGSPHIVTLLSVAEGASPQARAMIDVVIAAENVNLRGRYCDATRTEVAAQVQGFVPDVKSEK